MGKRFLLSGAAALMCSAAIVSAQTPATGAAPQVPRPGGATRGETTTAKPATPQTSTTEQASTAGNTLTGCVVRGHDVPGRSPNVANPAGANDQYVLMYSGSSQAVGTSGAATPGAVGSSGASAAAPTTNVGPIYKLEGVSSETLAGLVGKRVEVKGSIDKSDAAAKDDKDAAAPPPAAAATSGDGRNTVGTGSQTQTGTDANAGRGDEKDHWTAFRATSIREVDGSCPAAGGTTNR